MSENSNEENEKTESNVLEGGMSKEVPTGPLNIVINGGGVNLFNIYGALKQSNLSGIWSHDSVQSYYGTSAGGIMSVIMALQYSWEELDDFIIKRPWQNVWKFNVLKVYDYYLNKGIYGIELFKDMIGPLFKGKDLDLTITLKEFFEITGKHIHLYATKLSTFEITEFSHKTHPNMEVLTALHASAGLPILFKPAEYDGELYTDGGFLINYPLAKCTDDPATILGIRNVYTASNANVNEVQGMFEYLSYILNIVTDKNQCLPTVKPGYEILLNAEFVDYSSIFKLANSQEERETLIKKGAEDAIQSLLLDQMNLE
jgi:predicted acylesterase/phospholipase RssA